MSKTYKDSRRDDKKNRREENTRKRLVKNKEQKRQNKFKQFLSYEDDGILLVHSDPHGYYEDDDWVNK